MEKVVHWGSDSPRTGLILYKPAGGCGHLLVHPEPDPEGHPQGVPPPGRRAVGAPLVGALPGDLPTQGRVYGPAPASFGFTFVFAEGGGRTHTPLTRNRLLRPARLPFRHFGTGDLA